MIYGAVFLFLAAGARMVPLTSEYEADEVRYCIYETDDAIFELELLIEERCPAEIDILEGWEDAESE